MAANRVPVSFNAHLFECRGVAGQKALFYKFFINELSLSRSPKLGLGIPTKQERNTPFSQQRSSVLRHVDDYQ